MLTGGQKEISLRASLDFCRQQPGRAKRRLEIEARERTLFFGQGSDKSLQRAGGMDRHCLRRPRTRHGRWTGCPDYSPRKRAGPTDKHLEIHFHTGLEGPRCSEPGGLAAVSADNRRAVRDRGIVELV